MQFFLAVVGIATQGTALIEPPCESYVGQSISPLTFSQAVTRIPIVQPKGEFETTADFEKRKQVTTASLGSRLLISKVVAPWDVFFKYNADTQKLGVTEQALTGISNFPAYKALNWGRTTEKLISASLSASNNLYVQFSSTRTYTGWYKAQNSFGAEIEVAKVLNKEEVIFEREMEESLEGSFNGPFPAADGPKNDVVGYLDLPIAEAQRLKPLLRVVYVVEPKEPYLVKNSFPHKEASFSDPEEVRIDATVMIADFKCGLVTDNKNVVLGAYPTR